MTRRHVEEITGIRGGAALGKCRKDIAISRVRLRLVAIHGVDLRGARALVEFTAALGPNRQRQILRVTRRGGRWYFDGDGSRGL